MRAALAAVAVAAAAAAAGCGLPAQFAGSADGASIPDAGDAAPDTDAVPGADAAPGTDAGTPPFVLAPAIPTILSAWACSATGGLAPTGTTALLFDTDTGEILDFDNAVVLRPAGTGIDVTTGIRFEIATQPAPAPAIGVFSFTSFLLPAGVRLQGNGANALGLFACGELHVEGLVDATGTFITPGPGGFAGGQGYGQPVGNGYGPDVTYGEAGANDVNGGINEGGGGGGGFGATGGAGGDCSDNVGGVGGGSAGVPALDPLRGGGGGGSAGCSNGTGALGGGGGGAVWIGAHGGVWIESVAGMAAGVNTGGGGGMGCPDALANGGGGGGAGGALLIESVAVTLGAGAALAANGGGGGGGSALAAGGDGARGALSAAFAAGGTSPGAPDGVGGRGGAATGPDGVAGTYATDGGGGGGGGAGRIRLNTLGGTATILGTVSPTAADLDPGGAPLFTQGTAASP